MSGAVNEGRRLPLALAAAEGGGLAPLAFLGGKLRGRRRVSRPERQERQAKTSAEELHFAKRAAC